MKLKKEKTKKEKITMTRQSSSPLLMLGKEEHQKTMRWRMFLSLFSVDCSATSILLIYFQSVHERTLRLSLITLPVIFCSFILLFLTITHHSFLVTSVLPYAYTLSNHLHTLPYHIIPYHAMPYPFPYLTVPYRTTPYNCNRVDL